MRARNLAYLRLLTIVRRFSEFGLQKQRFAGFIFDRALGFNIYLRPTVPNIKMGRPMRYTVNKKYKSTTRMSGAVYFGSIYISYSLAILIELKSIR